MEPRPQPGRRSSGASSPAPPDVPGGRAIRPALQRRTGDVNAHEILFRELDGAAPFHRDSALGRIFHPGTVSYREITATDSLHITVSGGNQVSVHVDRLSPLVVRPGRRCRYSLLRAVAHGLAHVYDATVVRCGRRRVDRRCRLDCAVAAAQPSPEAVYQFSCRAAGAGGCGWSTRAGSEEELVAKVAEHARRAHGVRTFSGTLAAYAVQVARDDGATP